jgi:hypothetical protein
MSKKRTSPPGLKRQTARPQQRQIPGWVWFTGGGFLAILLVMVLLYLGNWGSATTGGEIEGLVIFPDPGRQHQDGDINYAQDVPVGGPHNPAWQNCGIYDEPIREENVVHSMEHGAVWITYQPDLPTDQVEILRNLVRQEQSRRGERLIVLAPKPDLADPIVITAWRVQLRLTDASDERLPRFLRRYQRGPFYSEPGAPCIRGIGEPLN